MNSMLIKFPEEALSVDDLVALLRVPETDLRVYHAAEHTQTYAWVTSFDSDDLQAALCVSHPIAKLVLLTLTTDVAGHSAGQGAEWLYIVETDIKPEAQQDFDCWYETEHLPGLASVPGTVRATPWSDRVRPHFINTTRTMFRRVHAATEV